MRAARSLSALAVAASLATACAHDRSPQPAEARSGLPAQVCRSARDLRARADAAAAAGDVRSGNVLVRDALELFEGFPPEGVVDDTGMKLVACDDLESQRQAPDDAFRCRMSVLKTRLSRCR